MEPYRRLFTFPAEEASHQAAFAAEEWEEAVRLDPSNVQLRMTFCRILAKRGRYEEAIEHCDQCLRLQPSSGQLSLSRRLRIVAMNARLQRALRKHRYARK